MTRSARTRSIAALAPAQPELERITLPSVRAVIETRAVEDDEQRSGTPTAADLRLINALARRNLAADEVYVFDAAPSNNQLDAYYTRMAPSTLKNFARDAKAGVPIMNSHRTGGWFSELELPVGRSFRGSVDKHGELQTFHSSAYMVRGITISDVANDDLIAAIDAGTIFDVSIGFRGGWYKCGICKRDMFRDPDCDHYPGYPVDGDTDKRAWAWIEDASLGEWSLVYDGATPGAMIEKAQRMLADGRFSPGDIDELEGRLGVRIRPTATLVALPQRSETTAPTVAPVAGEETGERTEDMTGAELIASILERAGDSLPDETRAQLTAIAEQLRHANGTLADAAAAIAPLLNGQSALLEDDGETERLRQRVAELEQQAADGRAHREQLIADTLAAGVRAYGATFQRETWERVLREATRSLADIRTFHDDFERQARERLGPGGRHTSAVDPSDPSGLRASDPAAAPQRNLSVYRAP
jgi:hypothetical protein